jgi:hypothetical protein
LRLLSDFSVIFTKCAPEPLFVVVFQDYLSYSGLAGTDDEAVAGGFNDRRRDDMKVIHAENSLDLSEEPSQKPEISAAESNCRRSGRRFSRRHSLRILNCMIAWPLYRMGPLLTISDTLHGSTFKVKLTARGAAANCMSDRSTSKGTFLRVTAHFYRLRERITRLK